MSITSADSTPILISVKKDGATGEAGADGADGAGFNNVALSDLDNPLCWLFKKNQLTSLISGALTTSRAGGATYIDRYGVVKTLSNDQIGESKNGWGIYGSYTNKATYSEQFDNAAWFKALGATVSADTATAPDGTATADSFIPVAASPSYLSMSLSPKIGLNTFSVFVASDGSLDEITLLAPAAWFNSGIVQFVTYTFSTDSIIESGANIKISGRELLTNNYVRLFITVDAEIAVASGLQIRYALTDANGTTDNFKIWGAQLNDDYLKPYVPTVATAVTRLATNVTLPLLDNFSYNENNAYTILVKTKLSEFTGTNRTLFNIPVSSGLLRVFAHSAFNLIGFRQDSGVNNTVFTAYTPDSFLYIAAKSDGNTLSLTVNGVETTAAVTTVPTLNTAGSIACGSTGSTEYLGSEILDLRFYDRALNTDEIKLWSGI